VIVSLIAFVVLLATIAILLARLWQDDSLLPALRNGPGVTASVGDAVAVQGTVGGPAVEGATVAGAQGPVAVVEPPSGHALDAPAGPAVSTAKPASTEPAADPEGSRPDEGAEPRQPAPQSAPPAEETAPQAPAPIVVADTGGPAGRPGAGSDQLPPRRASLDPPGVGRAEFEIAEGGEYSLVFSFAAEDAVYRQRGEENLILRLRGETAEQPALGLQLWNLPDDEWYGSVSRGLWASGEATGPERLLAPLDDEWHQVEVQFRASSEPDGYYVVTLDGLSVDARAPVALLAPGDSHGVVEVGLFRDEPVEPGAGLHISGAQLTRATEPALP
jgi:hypothetical protein